ncbi:unnamed protein product [Brassicogethes aeneus]|uniref:RING-type domain-containing protein n=1 Tax=Brassicogethes aeneus TaxID=1431903 RepID=A0A9P0AZ38_BRAAE|nr:unnamed protein product [Brassicogethes aeneus]
MFNIPVSGTQSCFHTVFNVIRGVFVEMVEEMHYMEQFFIKLQNIYAFICQMCFFILCQLYLEHPNMLELKTDRSVVMALTTILFYSVMSYFVTRIKDICANNRVRSIDTTRSFRNYTKWICKIILEWLKAIVVVICLKEQGINYEPSLQYSLLTFGYFMCTEKIFIEIFPRAMEYLELNALENLEHMYIPLIMNMAAIAAGLIVSFYTVSVEYYPFVMFSVYFLIYLRCKDAYYNYWECIVTEKETYSSFRTATERDIKKWNDICAVCLNRMSRARITPCNHLFHPFCLKQCLRNSYFCPLCKQHFIDTHVNK